MGRSFAGALFDFVCRESFTAKLINHAGRNPQVVLREFKIIVVNIIHLNDADGKLRPPILLDTAPERKGAPQAGIADNVWWLNPKSLSRFSEEPAGEKGVAFLVQR